MNKTGKEKLRKYTVVVFSIVVLVGLAVWSWLSHTKPQETPLPQQEPQAKLSPTTSQDHDVVNPPEPLAKPEVDSPLDFHQCNKFVDELGQFELEWWYHKLEQRETYLAQGYTLDEITVAMEAIDVPIYGGDWRASKLREAVGAVEIKHPDSPYGQFTQMQPEQRSELMRRVKPDVNDVASAIFSKDISDLEIMSMFRLVEQDRRVVSLDWSQSLNLVDWALEYGRPELALELMDAGVEPSSDGFLANSLEMALFFMLGNERSGGSPDKTRTYGKVVKRLLDAGYLARMAAPHEIEGYNKSGQNRVFLSLPDRNHITIFLEKDINRYWDQYRINLEEVVSAPAFVTDKSLYKLKNKLDEERIRSVETKFQIEDPEQHLASCLKIMTNFGREWQQYKSYELINQSFEDFAVTDVRAEAFLHPYDPSLVDCRRVSIVKKKLRDVVGINAQIVMHSVAEPAKQGNESASLARQHYVNWMGLSNLFNDPEIVLPREGLGQTPHYWLLSLSDFTLENMKRMVESGFDLRLADSVGRDVSHYATSAGEPELLQWLIDNDYPYHSSQFGQDPLHLALDIRGRPHSPEKVVELVQVLLSKELDIDQHHRRRLALIRARQPDLYAELVELDGRFQVDDDQQLPLSYCELFGYLPTQYRAGY